MQNHCHGKCCAPRHCSFSNQHRQSKWMWCYKRPQTSKQNRSQDRCVDTQHPVQIAYTSQLQRPQTGKQNRSHDRCVETQHPVQIAYIPSCLSTTMVLHVKAIHDTTFGDTIAWCRSLILCFAHRCVHPAQKLYENIMFLSKTFFPKST